MVHIPCVRTLMLRGQVVSHRERVYWACAAPECPQAGGQQRALIPPREPALRAAVLPDHASRHLGHRAGRSSGGGGAPRAVIFPFSYVQAAWCKEAALTDTRRPHRAESRASARGSPPRQHHQSQVAGGLLGAQRRQGGRLACAGASSREYSSYSPIIHDHLQAFVLANKLSSAVRGLPVTPAVRVVKSASWCRGRGLQTA